MTQSRGPASRPELVAERIPRSLAHPLPVTLLDGVVIEQAKDVRAGDRKLTIRDRPGTERALQRFGKLVV